MKKYIYKFERIQWIDNVPFNIGSTYHSSRKKANIVNDMFVNECSLDKNTMCQVETTEKNYTLYTVLFSYIIYTTTKQKIKCSIIKIPIDLD